MTKKLLTLALVSGALILTACGGGSSSDSKPQAELSEQGQEISDNAKKDNSDAFENQDAVKNGGYPTCKESGKTVLVDEGTTCKHTATTTTVSCHDNKVSISGITATEINMFGYKFICQ